MNKKLVRGSLAGVAAIALAAGGTTFAAWSDFAVDAGNKVGADVLTLDLAQPSQQMQFDDVALAPGDVRDLAFYVTTKHGTTIKKVNLTMTLEDMKGSENGCDSNSEAYAESNGTVADKLSSSAPCNTNKGEGSYPNLKGQFADQAIYYVQSGKLADPSQCNTSGAVLTQSAVLNTRLSDMANKPVDLLKGTNYELADGEGVCVLAQIFLPQNKSTAPNQFGWSADNKSQGDSASFDVRFDLTQQVS